MTYTTVIILESEHGPTQPELGEVANAAFTEARVMGFRPTAARVICGNNDVAVDDTADPVYTVHFKGGPALRIAAPNELEAARRLCNREDRCIHDVERIVWTNQ